MKKKNVVIIGGGFGGIYTAIKLACMLGDKVNITVVDRRNYFLFTPLLHEVAASTISDKIPVESLSFLLAYKNIDWKVGTLKNVKVKDKLIETDNFLLKYDYLVLATGAVSNDYNIKGINEFSFKLKDLGQAIAIKNQIIENFELANVVTDPIIKKKLLSITVIGAGPTGIELTGELADFVEEVVSKYYLNINKREVNIYLVNQTSEILPNHHKKVGKWVKQYLKKESVKFLFDLSVKKLEQDKVYLSNNSIVDASLIIWTAGVKPTTINFDEKVDLDKANRILVTDNLNLEKYPEIFVLGDLANTKSGLPMLAQVAVQQSQVVAKNIKQSILNKELDVFIFKNNGFLVSVGKWNGVGEFYGIPVKGAWVWILWHFVYFMKFISWNKRTKILFDWILNLFSYRDVSIVEDIAIKK